MIPCVRVKNGVRVDPMTPALARMLAALDTAARWRGHDLTVTCGREGHPPTDPHTLGKALDVRVLDLSPDDTLKIYQYLRALLGDLFEVLYETPTTPTLGALKNIATINPRASGPHFHTQVKIGVVYPPQDVTGPVKA